MSGLTVGLDVHGVAPDKESTDDIALRVGITVLAFDFGEHTKYLSKSEYLAIVRILDAETQD